MKTFLCGSHRQPSLSLPPPPGHKTQGMHLHQNLWGLPIPRSDPSVPPSTHTHRGKAQIVGNGEVSGLRGFPSQHATQEPAAGCDGALGSCQRCMNF